MSVERQRAILEQQLEEITDEITDMKRKPWRQFSIKQLEKDQKNTEAEARKAERSKQ
jgi:hypothetical protein